MLSGNRNFEGRVNPDVQANYLASPPLVVAYALAGSMRIDISTEPIGQDKKGKDVFLKDIWPTSNEIADIQKKSVTPAMFAKRYADVFKGDKHWQGIKVTGGQTYAWDEASTYVAEPALFRGPVDGADPGHRHRRGPRAGHLRRLDHHRPHQPGRFDQEDLARPAPI